MEICAGLVRVIPVSRQSVSKSVGVRALFPLPSFREPYSQLSTRRSVHFLASKVGKLYLLSNNFLYRPSNLIVPQCSIGLSTQPTLREHELANERERAAAEAKGQ